MRSVLNFTKLSRKIFINADMVENVIAFVAGATKTLLCCLDSAPAAVLKTCALACTLVKF